MRNLALVLVTCVALNRYFVVSSQSPANHYETIQVNLKKNVNDEGDLEEVMKATSMFLKGCLADQANDSDIAETLKQILALEDPSCSFETYKKVSEATFYSRSIMPPGGQLYSYVLYWRGKRALFCAYELELDYLKAIEALDQNQYKKLETFLSNEFIEQFVQILIGDTEVTMKDFILNDKCYLDLTKIHKDSLLSQDSLHYFVSGELSAIVKERWSELFPDRFKRFETLKESIIEPCEHFRNKLWLHFNQAKTDFEFSSPLLGYNEINDYVRNFARFKLCHSIISQTSQGIFIEGILDIFGDFW